MVENKLFKINDFAKLARTTKDTLVHYDKIGLLSPAFRGENNYRYYSGDQLTVVNLIRTFQNLGMSLTEIKELGNHRTPESIEEIFKKQSEDIEKKIGDWVQAKTLLTTLQGIMHSARNIDENEITVKFCSEEAIILGDLNDYNGGKNEYDALFEFYHSMKKNNPDINFNYPVWGMFEKDRIQKGDWNGPDRYYLYNPEGTDRKSAGFYAIGYTHGRYGQCGPLYKKMMEYIDSNNYEISGNTYEEYLFNEISVIEKENYLIRVMIGVREKT